MRNIRRPSISWPRYLAVASAIALLLALAAETALALQDKYKVTVPGGLAFAEFRGYEDWRPVSVSKTDHAFAIIVANPTMIEAYRAGIPGNGKPFPEGSKIAKIHYKFVKNTEAPDTSTEVPGVLLNVDFIEKDGKRFRDPDSGGWGYAAFEYDATSGVFRPAGDNDTPPQGHDAACGVACHTLARNTNFIFTAYPKR